MYQTHDQADRASVLRACENGFAGAMCALARKPWRMALASVLALSPVGAAWAAVLVESWGAPPSASLGLHMPFTADINWSRSGAGGNTVTVTLPSQVEVAPAPYILPPECTVTGSNPTVLECTTSTAANGVVSLQLVSTAVGAINVAAQGTTGGPVLLSRTIQASGDLTVAKSKVSPAGNVIAGENMEFLLEPKIEAGSSGVAGSDLMAGMTIVVTDTLPAGVTGVTRSFTGLNPSCSQVGQVLTCTYTGPFTAAAFNASTITVRGTQGAGNGGFTNNASIAVGTGNYLERDNTNNTAQVNYTVLPGSDIQAQGSFPGGPHAVGDTDPKTLTITYRNNGPMASMGGTVQTVIPAAFDFDPADLPGECSAVQNSSLQVPAGGTTYNGWVVTCTFVATVNSGDARNYPIPLKLPAAAMAGNFPVLVTPPGGLNDANPANNDTTVAYDVRPPFANLSLTKSKNPSTGPVAPATVITNTLRVTNSNDSSSALTYSSPNNPLRVVDYLVPQEVDTSYGTGGVITSTAGWDCVVATGVVPPAGFAANRTTRITCTTNNVSTQILAKGAHAEVQFSTRVAAMAANATPVTLSNEACTGAVALSALGLAQTDGPLPVSNGDETRGDVCKTAGANLVATPTGATANSALVTLVKQSSITGNRAVPSDWFDAVSDAPELAAGANTLYWRILITTPNTTDNPDQQIIRTLRLSDMLPGILNSGNGNTTPAVPISVWRGNTGGVLGTVPAGSTTNNCPGNIAAGANGGSGTLCTFTDVNPGETIEIVLNVSRPLGQGAAQGDGTYRLTNTATLTSPNALIGTITDAAAVDLQPRLDVELRSKTLSVPTPAIGQPFNFTLEARNLGPFEVPVGDFVVEDTLYTGSATLVQEAYEILTPAPFTSVTGFLNCTLTDNGNSTTTVRCVNTQVIPSGNTETVNINVRLKKPALDPVNNPGHVANATLYTGLTNTATVTLDAGLCEYRVNGGAQNSSTCSDANSETNNSKTATFNVLVPRIDLEQNKVRVDGAGNPVSTPFKVGQPLRYQFTVTNHGPSRAESVEMVDTLTPLPADFTFTMGTVTHVSGKQAFCTQPGGANTDIVCHFGMASKIGSDLEASEWSTFIVDLTMVDNRPPTSVGAVLFGNLALVCGDETVAYETAGRCSTDGSNNNNNVENVQHLILPVADLGITKSTQGPDPVDVGQAVEYRMVVDNKGVNATDRIRVVDTLPAGFEWLTTGAHAPAAVANGVNASLSAALTVSASVPAVGAGNVCFISNGSATVTARTQQQEITCDLQGVFPVLDGVVTLTLWAQPKLGIYDGIAPALYNMARTNTAVVKPGINTDGDEVAEDSNPANNTGTSTVAVKAGARIGGRVFFDQNDNGDVDAPGDTGIDNVTLTLTGTDIYGNPVSLTTTSNASGDYEFVGLPPSNPAGYTITQDQTQAALSAYSGNGMPQPNNTLRTNRNAPSNAGVTDKGTASNTATSSVISGIVVTNDAQGVQFDFPEYVGRSLSGHVYVDLNNNQVRDAGTDTPIAGAIIELLVLDAGVYVPVTDAGGPITATTDGSGLYQFTGLSPSKTYALREVLPSAPVGTTYVNQPLAVNPGQINGVACAPAVCVAQTGQSGDAATTDRIEGIVLAAGNGTQFNFGEVMATTIGGRVYLDRDDNGDFAPATDAPIGGVTIVIEEETSPGVWTQVHTQATATDGTYQWDQAIVGHNYRITETQPTGLAEGRENGSASGTPNVVVVNNLPVAGSTDNDFGELAASIAGRVWLDLNNNGVVDPGEDGIANVTVSLPAGTVDALGNPVASVTTDANGNYRFDDLLAGTYVVTEQAAQPVVTVGGSSVTTLNGHTVAGTIGGTTTGTATDRSVTPSAVSGIVLGAGQASIANNFGETLPVSVSGIVFFDTDNDGTQNNAGDTGIAGVEIVLTGTDDLGNPVNLTTNTGPDGSFSFDGLRPGTYTLTEPTQPPGTVNGHTTAGSAGGTATPVGTTPSAIATIDLTTPGSSSANNLFAEVPQNSSISGQVWMDMDDDGQVNGSEPGIAGVTVTLSGTDIAGNPVTRTTTTDAQGRYAFDNLAPGTYTVTEPNQPAGTRNGQTVPGSTGGTATPVTTTPSAISNIVLGANQESINNNFGEIPQNSSISGRVWLDGNNNGVVDAGEEGIAGVTVRLTGTDVSGNPVSAEVVTDADGNYLFDNLAPGTYTVTEPEQPANTLNGQTVVGSTGGSATDVDTVPSVIRDIPLGANQHSTDNNFGELKPASIAGRVWNDNNDDGVVDAGETGIPNVEIVLTGTDDQGNPVNVTVTTDADGNYRFDNLRPGTYTVTEPTQPADTVNGQTVPGSSGGTATPRETTPSAISTIVLESGEDSTENNFGEIPYISKISGRVWLDANNNGVVDAGEEGIAGVTVRLTGTDVSGNPVSAEVVTDAEGRYLFDNLAPGTYTVTEPEQPANTLNGQTVVGSTGGSATDVDTVPSVIRDIPLGANQHSTDNNFGELKPASIAGRVWNDNNDNGTVDPGETGIPGQEIVLEGIDDQGNPVRLTTTTDADGNYRFDNLRPGRYKVTQPNQPPQTESGQTVPGTSGGTGTPKNEPVSVIDEVVLESGTDSEANNFGEISTNLADMRVSKSVTPETLLAGDAATYTVVVRNAGEGVTHGEYEVHDRLPAGVTLAEVPTGDGWSCSGAVGGERFSCRSDRVLAAGQTSPAVIRVPVNVSALLEAGTLNNAVLVRGGGEPPTRGPTPEETDALETGNVTVLPVCEDGIVHNACRLPSEVIRTRPDMRVSKSVTPETLRTGTTATYTLVVRNAGDRATDAGYEVRDRLPAGMTLAGLPTGEGWVCSGAVGEGRFSCLADRVLAAGEVSPATITVPVRIGTEVEAGTVNNAVLVRGGGEPDSHGPTPEEEQALEDGDVTVLPVCENGIVHNACRLPSELVKAWPDVVVNKVADTDVFTVGEQVNYRIRVRNIGERATDGEYVVTDRLPTGLVLAGVPAGEGWACTGAEGDGTFQCLSAQVLAADAIHPGVITVPVTVLPEALDQGTVNNAVIVSGGGEDPDRQPTDEERGQFENHPEELAVCGTQITQNLCRVPNGVQPPQEDNVLVITKRGDRAMAEIGDMVLYTIEVRNISASGVRMVNIVDTLPRGFTYIDGTARAGGRVLPDPLGKPGPRLGFELGPLAAGGQLVLTYRVRIGVGAQQGDGVNRAQAHGCWTSGSCIDPGSLAPLPGSTPSNRAEYRVRVSGGVFAEEACVLGKVFVDCNLNHVQDEEELGIPGVRLYFSDGTWLISDSEGKYSYCGLPPQSHTLKVDPSTLPVGSRLTTSSNRNLGDADSLFLDLKNGELHRADFVEGSCSNPVLEQVKARRTQGEVRAPETEPGQSQLRFESKPFRAPQQATDSANQRPIVEPRPNPPAAAASQEVQP